MKEGDKIYFAKNKYGLLRARLRYLFINGITPSIDQWNKHILDLINILEKEYNELLAKLEANKNNE